MKSPGEQLCALLYYSAIDPDFWSRFESKHLIATGRSTEFREFFQESIALNLTRRLILAGESAKAYSDPLEPGFLDYISPAINRWGLQTLNQRGRLARLVKESVIASNHGISRTLRTSMIGWSKTKHPMCYMCGVQLNQHLQSENPRFDDITLDHIWPQAYGGDSIEENLLPACRACNSDKKQDYPTWAGCDIHTLIIGDRPSEEALRSVGGRFKFALHNRAVRRLANRDGISLRRSYVRIGCWTTEPWLLDEEEIGDFFNLENYQPERISYAKLFL